MPSLKARTALVQALGDVAADSRLRLQVLGENEVGDPRRFTLLLPVPEGASGEERLQALGLQLIEEDGRLLVDNVAFGSLAAQLGLEFDQQILAVRAPTDRWTKEWMWLPGLALLGLLVWLQWRRRPRH